MSEFPDSLNYIASSHTKRKASDTVGPVFSKRQ